MEKKLHEALCRECHAPLVIEDENGNLKWGMHERFCTARYPSNDSPGLKSAKAKLACGSSCKRHHSAQISDLGTIAICKGCPNEALARASVVHAESRSDRKFAEVIYPARHRYQPASPFKQLYLDLLERYAALERKFKRSSR